MTRCRTFRFRIYPTVKQAVSLTLLLRLQCELYNAGLEERRGAWRWERRSVGYISQTKTLTELREARPDILAFGVTVCRGTLKRLDRAFGGFYARCKRGQTPGYPRFKSVSRWDSVQWEDTSGWRIDTDSRRLHLFGVGAVKLNIHRPIRGTPKAVTLRREGRHWSVSIRCVEVPAEPLPHTGKEIGIDVGVGVLVATSEGRLTENDAPGRRAQQKLAAAQRALATKKKGSHNRRKAVEAVARTHRKVRHRRADVLHKLSRQLVNDHDLIVCEAIRTRNMVRRPKPRPDGSGGYEKNGATAKSSLNRSIYDAGWGQLLSMLAYKAEEAGRTLIQVDPRNTSRRCSHCGHVDKENRRGAAFECLGCGHRAHADTNAATNILRAGRAQQLQAA